MLDFNVITSLIVIAVLILFIRIVFPYLKRKGYSNIYGDVKLGLLLFGYSFRDEKVRQITDMILIIVSELEKLDLAPEIKKVEAIDLAFRVLIDELGIEIEEKAISTIINIAVSYLPPTNKELI